MFLSPWEFSGSRLYFLQGQQSRSWAKLLTLILFSTCKAKEDLRPQNKRVPFFFFTFSLWVLRDSWRDQQSEGDKGLQVWPWQINKPLFTPKIHLKWKPQSFFPGMEILAGRGNDVSVQDPIPGWDGGEGDEHSDLSPQVKSPRGRTLSSVVQTFLPCGLAV